MCASLLGQSMHAWGGAGAVEQASAHRVRAVYAALHKHSIHPGCAVAVRLKKGKTLKKTPAAALVLNLLVRAGHAAPIEIGGGRPYNQHSTALSANSAPDGLVQ